MKATAIIQARMSSSRLAGKVLIDLAGRPMLARVVERARKARQIDEVIIATTTENRDDAIVALCEERRWPVFRGNRDDVLDRYYQAASSANVTNVVRLTSDCPATDPQIIDSVIERLTEGIDYVSNVIPRRTFPRGLDVEAFTTSALGIAWRDARDPASREHVTPYLYRTPDQFHIASVESSTPEDAVHRWTVDTPEDYELMRRIYAHFGNNDFGWRDVLALLASHPEWSDLNRLVPQTPH